MLEARKFELLIFLMNFLCFKNQGISKFTDDWVHKITFATVKANVNVFVMEVIRSEIFVSIHSV